MRITGGKFRGRQLVSPSNNSIRPSSDRLRVNIFNVLSHSFIDQIENMRVLDLFSGTGSLGLEALSRGATHCLFVDIAAEARAIIRENVENLGLTGNTRIFRRDATKLGNVDNIKPFDLVFLDPPYNKGLTEPALISAFNGNWLKPDALCISEESRETEIEVPENFEVVDTRNTGTSKTIILRVKNL